MDTLPNETEAQVAKPTLEESVLASLETRVPRPKTAFFYRLGALGVALLVALLPAIYLALVSAVAFGVFCHVTENASLALRGRVGVFLYVAPILVGAIGLIFMLKPFLARRPTAKGGFPLSPKREPFLFEFVDALCDAVGAPRPRRIELDCQVNASAGFHQARAGLAGNRLVLTIGLPLVAGLSLRQLTGVLAHEFGHFSQGAGMRINLVIRKVLGWFARVVHQRDSWDDRLIRWGKSSALSVSLIGRFSQLLVWTTRKILSGLMRIGLAVASYFSRQMEYDADVYEIELTGSECFESTLRAITELSHADGFAQQRLARVWQDQRLVDDLAAWIIAHQKGFTDEVRARISASIEEEAAEVFATHPRSIDRIAAARSADREGVFDVDAPATVLFESFEELSQEVTDHHYRLLLGPAARRAQLLESHELFESVKREDEDQKCLAQFLQGQANYLRPLAPTGDFAERCLDPKQAGLRVKQLRKEVRELARDFERAFTKLVEVRQSLWQIQQAMTLKRIGIETRGELAEIAGRTTSAQRARKAAHEEQLEEIASQLEPFEQAAVERLTLDLRLLQEDVIASRIEGADRFLEEAQRLASVLQYLAPERETMEALAEIMMVIEMFVHRDQIRGDEDEGSLEKAFHRRLRELVDQLRGLASRGQELPYPFEHPDESITVGRWLVSSIPENDFGALFALAGEVPQRYASLYFRVFANLARIAERVEQAMGLAPLPRPNAQPIPAGEK